MFGENFTLQGFQEQDVRIGDKLRIGSALFSVTQPRSPCYKLGIGFGRDDMVKQFLHSGRTGFYLSVLEEGSVAAGDPVEMASKAEGNISVADVAALYAGAENASENLLQRAAFTEELAEGWRNYFLNLLSRLNAIDGPHKNGR